MKPTTNQVNDALESIARTERPVDHPRALAAKAVARYRRTAAIDPDYDFSAAPRAARQVIYDMTVRYSARHSLWARLWRR